MERERTEGRDLSAREVLPFKGGGVLPSSGRVTVEKKELERDIYTGRKGLRPRDQKRPGRLCLNRGTLSRREKKETLLL